MTLSLFPARVAIGRVSGPNGGALDVIMTPEFARALTDLFERVGGANGMSSDDLALLASFATDPGALEQDIFSAQLVEATAAPVPVVEAAPPAFDDVAGLVAQLEEMRARINDLEKHFLVSSPAVESELFKAMAAFEAQSAFTPSFVPDWERPGRIGRARANTGAFTTLSATLQITSTLATGTAPFVIASTTNVPNLNGSLLLGKTWAIPDPIGATTPNTGAFSTIAASGRISANLGLTVAGGTFICRGITDNATATALTFTAAGIASYGSTTQYFDEKVNIVDGDPKLVLRSSAGYSWGISNEGVTNNGKLTFRYEDGTLDVLVLDRLGNAVLNNTMTVKGGATFLTTSTALTDGAAAGVGTIANAPAAGNPTKWIGINDNGTTRYIPAW